MDELDLKVARAALELLQKHGTRHEPNLGRSVCIGCGRAMAASTAWTHEPNCPWKLALDGLTEALKEKG